MATERRKGERVTFERGIAAHMMGIDGTWRRDCIMEDISETGAKLTIEGSVEGLHLKEFFLLLSSTGLAYRRCELAWVNGDQIGVNFLKTGRQEEKGGAARGRRSLNRASLPSHHRHVGRLWRSASRCAAANRRDMIRGILTVRAYPDRKPIDRSRHAPGTTVRETPEMPVKPAKAMVLAAGLGLRMRPLTDRMPKPLVQVAGRALLDHVLDKLGDAGVSEAVVNVHYLPDQIIDHVAGAQAAPRDHLRRA